MQIPKLDYLIEEITRYHYLIQILEDNRLTKNDIIEMQVISEKWDIAAVEAKTLDQLVYNLRLLIREKSSGACVLSKIFINSKLYKQLENISGIKDDTIIKLHGSTVVSSNFVEEEVVWALAKPKFRICPIEFMLAKGTIKNGSN